MRYFALHQDVFFETGAQAGALYDFMRRRVQPLSAAQALILRQLDGDVPIAEVKGFALEEVETFVDHLCAESFGTRQSSVRRRDRFMPAMKIDLNGLVEPPLTLNVLHLALTSSCSLSCTGCGSREGAVWQGCNSCERWPGVPRDTAWTTAAIDKLMAEIEPLDVRSVFFNGGDPFAEPELLLHALHHLRQRKQPPLLFISTNGTATTPELLDRIAESGAKLNFVLLGETREEYAAVCGDASAFDRAMDAIAACQVRAIPFNVTLRFAELAPAEAVERRKWGVTLGAQRVYASERVQVDQNGGVHPAASLATTGRGRVQQVGPEQFFSRREKHPCLANLVAVGADLTVRPCPMIEDREFGHVGIEPLANVFRARRHEKYWNLTKNDIAGCSVCEFRFSCADCAAVDLAKRRQPELHAAICSYDPARGTWTE